MANPSLPPVIVSPVFVNGTSLIRAFGRRGARCVAVSNRANVAGFATRFTREKVLLEKVREKPEVFSQWLLEREDLYGALVIPTGDEILAALHSMREELSKRYRLCIPGPYACEVALDKAKLAEVGRAAGVPAPRTVFKPDEEEIETGFGLGWPVLVKPCYCINFHRIFSKKVVAAENAAELRDVLGRCREHSLEVVCQEMVGDGGAVAGYSAYVRRSGRIAGDISTRRVGMYPPGFGTGFLEVAERIEPVLDYGRRMVEATGYSGALLNLDFKLDVGDGQWKLLDFNARSWRQVSLAELSGFDVVGHLLSDYADGEEMPDSRVRYGGSWVYIKDALLMLRVYRKALPKPRELARLLLSRRTFGLLKLDDLRPFWEDIRPLVARRFKKRIQNHFDQ